MIPMRYDLIHFLEGNSGATPCGIWWSRRSYAWYIAQGWSVPWIEHSSDAQKVTCGACRSSWTVRDQLRLADMAPVP